MKGTRYLFITFEGVEGCGKTTQVELLKNYLDSISIPCIATCEPGGTRIGKRIREILLERQNAEIEPLTELLLYMADRAQHIRTVITGILKDDMVVICDRFSDATLAYQGFGRGLPINHIIDLNEWVVGSYKPHCTILIDCPVDLGLKRVADRFNLSKDRLEEEAITFHQRVREGYLKIASMDAKRIKVVDGCREPSEVHREIIEIISPYLTKIKEQKSKNKNQNHAI